MKRLIKYIGVISVVIISIILLISILNLSVEKPCPSSSGERLGSGEITEGLYKESNLIYNKGVLGGSVRSYYITDSTSFRKYIGKENDDENYVFLYKKRLGVYDDVIIVIKYAESVDTTDPIPIRECKAYVLKQLQEEGLWD